MDPRILDPVQMYTFCSRLFLESDLCPETYCDDLKMLADLLVKEKLKVTPVAMYVHISRLLLTSDLPLESYCEHLSRLAAAIQEFH